MSRGSRGQDASRAPNGRGLSRPASVSRRPYLLRVNALTRQAIGEVFAAWAAVSAPWKAEALANDDVSDMCILATGACASVMQAELGLDVEALPVDLYAWDEDASEYEPKVEHPVGSTAVQDGGYVGHVVAIVQEGGGRYIVDAELEVVAPFNGIVAVGEADGQRYMYLARAEHQEFSETNAWAKRGQAAAALSSALSADPR